METLRDLALIDDAHTDKVMYWLRQENVGRAIQDLKFTLDRFPNHPRALLLVELVGRITEVPTMAMPYYDKAVSLYPHYGKTWAQYGKYLVEIGKHEEGIRKLKRALELDPNMSSAHGWLSDAYLRAGKPDLASIESEKARKLGAGEASGQK